MRLNKIYNIIDLKSGKLSTKIQSIGIIVQKVRVDAYQQQKVLAVGIMAWSVYQQRKLYQPIC